MDRTVVALFDDVNTAQQALQDLLNSGFNRNDVSVVRANDKGGYTQGKTTTESDASGAAAGAGIGAALGGIAGLVIGLGVLAIPGIGPIVAAGPLATTLAGAGIGAAAGGIIGALTDAGIPEQEAGYYAEGVRRGGTLLAVRADESQVNRARDILNRYSPVDIDERAAQWRSTGWSGFDTNAGRYEGSLSDTQSSGAYSGAGSSGSYSGTGTSESYSSTGGTAGTGQYAGVGGAGGGYAERFEDFDTDFRRDFESRYRNTGYGYERYQPAYRYGYDLGNRYRGRDWNAVESDARRDWERQHPNDKWEDFKDAVRDAWQRVKSDVKDATD